ncbi:MAG: hypothetical protein IT383_29370 [Deltaproteobacteria bacterium]|nr:hypothetical protein [Deltaproteobacteria bacterium]
MNLGQPVADVTVPFARVFADGEATAARPGDRFIYDRKNGTLLIHRADADIHFASDAGLRQHCFVGREWTRELTQASAELYARLGGLRGQVRFIEGSFPTLLTFEVIG